MFKVVTIWSCIAAGLVIGLFVSWWVGLLAWIGITILAGSLFGLYLRLAAPRDW